MFGIVSTDLRTETTKFSDVFIELSSLCEFQHYQISFLLRFVVQFESGFVSVLNHVDEEGMLEFGQERAFEVIGLLFG